MSVERLDASRPGSLVQVLRPHGNAFGPVTTPGGGVEERFEKLPGDRYHHPDPAVLIARGTLAAVSPPAPPSQPEKPAPPVRRRKRSQT